MYYNCQHSNCQYKNKFRKITLFVRKAIEFSKMFLIRGLQRNRVTLTHIKANIRALSILHTPNTLKDEKIKDKYDIIVAGGGMVGCTLACGLGNLIFKKTNFRNITLIVI